MVRYTPLTGLKMKKIKNKKNLKSKEMKAGSRLLLYLLCFYFLLVMVKWFCWSSLDQKGVR